MYVGKEEIREAFYKAVKKEVEKWSNESADDIEGFVSVSRIEGMIALVEELTKEEE